MTTQTITPALQGEPASARSRFVADCIRQARQRQWGSVTPVEATANNTATTATGAYPMPDHIGDDVVMIDITNLGTTTEAVTARLLGEDSP